MFTERSDFTCLLLLREFFPSVESFSVLNNYQSKGPERTEPLTSFKAGGWLMNGWRKSRNSSWARGAATPSKETPSREEKNHDQYVLDNHAEPLFQRTEAALAGVDSLGGGSKRGGKECSSERLQEHRTPRGWQVPGTAKAKWAGVSLELSRTAELGGVAKEIRII